MDIRSISHSTKQYKYIFVLLYEVINFLIALPLKTTQSVDVYTAIVNGYLKYFGFPIHFIFYEDPTFMSILAKKFFLQFGINIPADSVTNQKSLLAQHGIESLSNILMKHLSGLSQDWDNFLGLTMLNYNSSNSPNIDGQNPIECVLGHKAKICPSLAVTPEVALTGAFKIKEITCLS